MLKSNVLSGNENHRLVILGDVVDRGPESLRNFIAVLYLLANHYQQVTFIPGNHEYEIRNKKNPAVFPFSSFFNNKRDEKEKISAFIDSCPCQAITQGAFNYFFSHGGIAVSYKNGILEKSSSTLILQDLLANPINAYWSDYDKIIAEQFKQQMMPFNLASERLSNISLSARTKPENYVEMENYNTWINLYNQWKVLFLNAQKTIGGFLNEHRGHNEKINYIDINAYQCTSDLCGDIEKFIRGHGHFNGEIDLVFNDDQKAQLFTIHSTKEAMQYSLDSPHYGEINKSKFEFKPVPQPRAAHTVNIRHIQ